MSKKHALVFRPIAEAPVSKDSAEQILCRFWYPHFGGHWVYYVARGNGARTQASGYAAPEEFALLPLER